MTPPLCATRMTGPAIADSVRSICSTQAAQESLFVVMRGTVTEPGNCSPSRVCQ